METPARQVRGGIPNPLNTKTIHTPSRNRGNPHEPPAHFAHPATSGRGPARRRIHLRQTPPPDIRHSRRLRYRGSPFMIVRSIAKLAIMGIYSISSRPF